MTTMLTEVTDTSVIDDYVIEAFTCGDCWRLALTMREQYGLPIAFFAAAPIPSEKPFVFDATTMWCHVFNMLPDGRFIDVNGIATSEKIHGDWENSLWISCDEYPMIIVPTEAEVDVMLSGVDSIYPDVDADAIAKTLGALLR